MLLRLSEEVLLKPFRTLLTTEGDKDNKGVNALGLRKRQLECYRNKINTLNFLHS